MRCSEERIRDRRLLLIVRRRCLLLGKTNRLSDRPRTRRRCLNQAASDAAERRPPARVPQRANGKARGDSILPDGPDKKDEGELRLQSFRITSTSRSVIVFA